MNFVLIGLGVLAAAFIGPLAVLAQAPAAKIGAPMFVIAADPEAVLEQAGAQTVGPLIARFGVLAQAEDAQAIDRIYAAGAWRVTDGAWLASLCGVDET